MLVYSGLASDRAQFFFPNFWISLWLPAWGPAPVALLFETKGAVAMSLWVCWAQYLQQLSVLAAPQGTG